MSTIADIFANYYQYFLRGTRTTIVVSLVTVFFGALIGCLIALLRLSKYKPLSGFAKLYITVIRGTPLLVQLYIVYYQLNFIHYPSGSFLGVELARVIPCIIALSINSGAYVAEVIRAGIQAVDFGQTEAALSCGMTYPQCMWNIVLPQAVKNILPAIGNEFVTLIKESSLLSVLAISDLTMVGQQVRSVTYASFETFIFVALVYLFLTSVTSGALQLLESRWKVK